MDDLVIDHMIVRVSGLTRVDAVAVAHAMAHELARRSFDARLAGGNVGRLEVHAPWRPGDTAPGVGRRAADAIAAGLVGTVDAGLPGGRP